MTSAIASPIRDDQGKKIGTVAITLNMEGLNILHSPYINLPNKFFYFVITGKMDVVWHSQKGFVNTKYDLTEYFFADSLPPNETYDWNPNVEKDQFLETIKNGVNNISLEFGTFQRQSKTILFAKSPIILKYSLNETELPRTGTSAADFFVYLCISRTDFADQSFSSIKIEGNILAVVIILPISLVFVIFLTYG